MTPQWPGKGLQMPSPLLNVGRWESAHICERRGKAVSTSLSGDSLHSSILHEILECKAEMRQLISRLCFLVCVEVPCNPLFSKKKKLNHKANFYPEKHFLCYITEAQVTDSLRGCLRFWDSHILKSQIQHSCPWPEMWWSEEGECFSDHMGKSR